MKIEEQQALFKRIKQQGLTEDRAVSILIEGIEKEAQEALPDSIWKQYIAWKDNGNIRECNLNLSLTPVEEIEEKEAEWLVSGYIPKRQITAMAGDGGCGKTSVWCGIAAAVSNGIEPQFLNDVPFEQTEHKNKKVFYFSAEDSTEIVLRKRLRLQGADLQNILTIPINDERFSRIKFDSPLLKQLVSEHKPTLVIFDPVQAFVPATIKMGDRNAMRQCLEPLIACGEEYGTTFIIVVHSNKRPGAWGRNRIADSADIWDISRSVLIVGNTNDDGVKYLSHEKSNYGRLSDTVLFSIEDDVIIPRGRTTKRDRDFVTESDNTKRPSPAKDEAKRFILETLHDVEEIPVKELDDSSRAVGISIKSMRSAKEELKQDSIIRYRKMGKGKNKGVQWYISLQHDN